MAWGQCPLPEIPVPKSLRDELRKKTGRVPGWASRIASSPWLARALCVGKPIAHAPLELCDLAMLVVSQDNSCRYCYGFQRAYLQLLGYTEPYIQKLERDLQVADLPRKDKLALEFVRKISRANPRPTPDEFQELVQAGHSPQIIAELAFMAAITCFHNRVCTMLAFSPEESFEAMVHKPLFGLIRPLMAWFMRPKQRRPAAPLDKNDGPCAPVIAALYGSPSAAVLRSTIDEAFQSPVLPRRSKALMVAVIGKALGCSYCENEARRLLDLDGVTAADVDEVLANLASPKLDKREAALVPFARETARYQTAALQKRIHDLSRELSPEELVEAVGIASLANMVGRLSILLERC